VVDAKVEPLSTVPDPPAHLDKRAAAVWKRVAPKMEKIGALAERSISSFSPVIASLRPYLRDNAPAQQGAAGLCQREYRAGIPEPA